jgi:SAM-dependent methyltransferase
MTDSARSIARDPECPEKASLAAFLARNPFPNPYTLGFFYREKMRAIHRTAPAEPMERILDIGGGRSGITALLYPEAQVVSLDIDDAHASAACNNWPGVEFVCADAVRLPFPDRCFDAVVLFDLLEHVPDDGAVAREVKRVVRRGGWVLISTPKETWRYPHFRILSPICPPEEELFSQWGHVRRGYSHADLAELFGRRPDRVASFCSPSTALGHDIAFSKLRPRIKKAAWLATSPLTYLGYALDQAPNRGSEHVAAWRME